MRSFRTDCTVSAENVPETVRKRCELLVRDRNRLLTLTDAYANSDFSSLPESRYSVIVTEETARRAAAELRCIEEALEAIPEAYRQGIIRNIESRTAFSDIAHPNTWKKWKKIFIHELARNLHLI